MRKLNDNMKKFCEEYVKCGYKGGTAYGLAYGQEDKQICASEAYKMLRDPRIIEEIGNVEGSFRVLGQMAGLDKTAVVKILAEMLVAMKESKTGGEVPDHSARKGAIELFAKLTGDFKERSEVEIIDPDNQGFEGDLDELTEEEKKAMEQKLIAEL